MIGNARSLSLWDGKVIGRGLKTHNNFGSGEGFADNFTVVDAVPCSALTGVSVEPWKYEAVPESRFALAASPVPSEADYDTLEWESDNSSVATVDEHGVVTLHSLGEATVSARMTDRFDNSKVKSAKIVCTYTPDNSDIMGGVGNVSSDAKRWTVRTDNRKLIIENTSVGATFTVCNAQGIIVGRQNATSETLTFDIGDSGVFIIYSGNRAEKVYCQ